MIFSLISCEIELDLLWSKEFIISEILITPAQSGNPNANPPITDVAAIQTTRPTFEINNELSLCLLMIISNF